jgi:cell division protein FtsQ
MKYKYLKISILSITLIGLSVFSFQQNQSRDVLGIKVRFEENGARFMTLDSVNKLLTVKKTDTTNLLKSELNLRKMESILNQNHFIESAHVYLAIEGNVGVKIQEKTPIGRVMGSPGFYIDDHGNQMPLSPFYSARVPFVTSQVTQQNREAVYSLLDFISNDGFLKTHIVAIEEQNAKWFLTTRNHSLTIELGNQEDLERKFNFYKAFYIKALEDQNLSSYASVSLEYSNQVVCKKI